MKNEEKQKIMDSLNEEQRKGIGEIIRSADIEGEYRWDGEGSVWEESTNATLNCLANYFENYDPHSAVD